MLKSKLGIAPTPTPSGAFSPSPVSLALATSKTTDYDHTVYDNPYQGDKKILIIATEDGEMTMQNGKRFLTGNHPVELFVPMLHLQKAGFEFDIATPTGKAVKLETWAMPHKDKAVMQLYDAYQPKLSSPISLDSITTLADYVAVFLPGGHGAMLGLPDNPNVARLLLDAHDSGKFTLAICHGPAALLATNLFRQPFVYQGYQIATFPDSMDKVLPHIGYLPGKMPWHYAGKLSALGVRIVNHFADKTCHIDQKLITAASPLAANDFGKLSAKTLLDFVHQDNS